MWHISDISGQLVSGIGHTETVEPVNTWTPGNSHRGNSYRHGSTRTKTMGKLAPKNYEWFNGRAQIPVPRWHMKLYSWRKVYIKCSLHGRLMLCVISLSFSIGCTSSPKATFGQYSAWIDSSSLRNCHEKWTEFRKKDQNPIMTMERLKWVFWRKSIRFKSWWRHEMETFSPLLATCAWNSLVTGEFHAQRPVTWYFVVFFDLRSNKRLDKQSWGWWFETPSHPFWRHCNDGSALYKQRDCMGIYYIWYNVEWIKCNAAYILSDQNFNFDVFLVQISCLISPTKR